MRSPCLALFSCAMLAAACGAQTAPSPAPSPPAPAALPAASPTSPLNRFYGSPGPDGKPAAVVTNGCVYSQYFGFSYRLPSQATQENVTDLPAGGAGIGSGDVVFFVVDRRYQIPDFKHDDVAEAAAAWRGQDADPAAFLRQFQGAAAPLGNMVFGQIEPMTAGGQPFFRLRFQQAINGGLYIYQSVYAARLRAYVVYFIFRSRNPEVLAQLEQTMETFAAGDRCAASR
jgi:hypothetical protein